MNLGKWVKDKRLKAVGVGLGAGLKAFGSGRAIKLKAVGIGLGVVAISFLVSLKAMDWLSPADPVNAPAITELPPLPPASSSSFVVAPVSIALSAIRDAADRSAQTNLSGKADNPISQLLQNADIGWTASRGPITASGGQDALSLSTPLTGKLNITGSLSSKATGAVSDAIGSMLGANAAKQIGSVNIKAINASAEIKGNVTITARPKIAASWHLEPNFAAQVSLGDTNLSVSGAHINVPAQVKPFIDKAVAEQIDALSAKVRNNPVLEQTARLQWASACRSMPLQGTGATPAMPAALWLEVKPTRAIAMQPSVDASAITLTLGIEAETRVTPTQTHPDCPFPEKITIVPPTPGGLSIGVPIDLPFTEINRVVAAQFDGKTFPEDGSGPVDVTVKRATVTASGDRLLVSLLVHAKEKKSFFGFGADATVHIWGKPMLDDAHQTLRFTDVQLAVESEAAFGLLGAAARAVVPHLQQTLYDKAVIDLKPFAANAETKIAEAIADYQKNEDGVRVETKINDLRLADIAFDSKMLRVVAQAEGSINVYVTKLPQQ